MNDEEFFNLLNKYPLRSDNPTDNTTPTTSSQQPDLFSILNNVMSGFGNNNRISNSKEDEFWIKLKQFLDSNINSQEEANIIYNNFKKNHLKYINEQQQQE